MPSELPFSNGNNSGFSCFKSTSVALPKITIGLIEETKTPSDSRVLLTPAQCRKIIDSYPSIHLVVQSSSKRCYTDEEYLNNGVEVQSSPLQECDVLMGVKEVKIATLIPNKTYFFFSHTIKKQPYNRNLLRAVLKRNIRLIDYECLVGGAKGKRVIAFGRWAGIVGAHNAILAYGKKTGQFDLSRLYIINDYAKAKQSYKDTCFDGIRVVLTGVGRVGNGSAEVLNAMGFKKISPSEFLKGTDTQGPIYCQIRSRHLFGKKTDNTFDQSFYDNPENFHSVVHPYLSKANVLINGIFWDHRGPALFTLEEMKSEDFKIRVIGDITCDIAPEASIPCTIRPSTIREPVYGYDTATDKETEPYLPHTVDVMAVDNLPNELPRDASDDFGKQFITEVLPNLLDMDFQPDGMLDRASITIDGRLNSHFQYLSDYAGESNL